MPLLKELLSLCSRTPPSWDPIPFQDCVSEIEEEGKKAAAWLGTNCCVVVIEEGGKNAATWLGTN